MKERFMLTRRAYPEHRDALQHPIALGRWYRRAGRICLLGSAVTGGVEIFGTVQGDPVSPVTLRSLLNLSLQVTAPAFNPAQTIIEFVVGSSLWFVLMVIAAIPYALAIHRFIKEKAAREAAVRQRIHTVL